MTVLQVLQVMNLTLPGTGDYASEKPNHPGPRAGPRKKSFRRRNVPMRRIFMISAAVLFCAAAATAQTKVTGTAQCGKPDPQQVLPVGDRPGHMLGIAQIKCTYTKPMEIGGDKSKDGVSTETSDISGNTSHPRGFHVVTMESGDK